MKRMMGLTIAALLMIGGLAGCGTKATAPASNSTPPAKHTVSDEQKAAMVAKQTVSALTSFTYKQQNSFSAAGKFMTAKAAAFEDKSAEGLIKKYDANNAVARHGAIQLMLLGKLGNGYKFDVKTPVSITNIQTNETLANVNDDYDVTVKKQSNGQFLVSSVKVISD